MFIEHNFHSSYLNFLWMCTWDKAWSAKISFSLLCTLYNDQLIMWSVCCNELPIEDCMTLHFKKLSPHYSSCSWSVTNFVYLYRATLSAKKLNCTCRMFGYLLMSFTQYVHAYKHILLQIKVMPVHQHYTRTRTHIHTE